MNSRRFIAEEVFLDEHVWGTVQGTVYYAQTELGCEFDSVDVDMLCFVWVEGDTAEEHPLSLTAGAVESVCESVEEHLRDNPFDDASDVLYVGSIYVPNVAGKYTVAQYAAVA